MKKFNSAEYVKELTFEEEIDYKGLKFKPITVYNYNEFQTSIPCMLLDKNSVPDINIIRMSYLDYIFYLSAFEDTSYLLGMLATLLKLSIDITIDDIQFYMNEKSEYVLLLKGVEIDKNDFLYIREIICAQNNVDLSIFNLDPRVREELKKTIELKGKNSGFEMATLEEQIICVLISTSLSEKEIRDLSLRKFKKILDRVDHKMHYEIYTLGAMRGDITIKDGIPHWLNTLEKDKFDGLITSYKEVQNKVQMSNSGI